MTTVELMRARKASAKGERILKAFEHAVVASGDRLKLTDSYKGGSEWLILFGIGADVNTEARAKHKGRTLHLDLGYIGRPDYYKVCIDQDHPQDWIEKTDRPSRLDIQLREDADQKGPTVLVGIGRKTRRYRKLYEWERDKLKAIKGPVIYRPKGREVLPLGVKTDATSPIESVLKGASKVVCMHSNVAIDAAIAGVPFECEDGAAMWLQRREFTRENRAEFIRRLSWWQWKPEEAGQAWQFVKEIAA